MKEKQIKLPGPDHPISIQHNPARVVVFFLEFEANGRSEHLSFRGLQSLP
jgi:hypothetical protein